MAPQQQPSTVGLAESKTFRSELSTQSSWSTCTSEKGEPDSERCPDQRGYTPIPLRRWYLFSLLVYICLLLVVLEYSFQVLPQVSSRQTSPPQYFKPPNMFNQRRTIKTPAPSIRRRQAHNTTTTATTPGTTPGTTPSFSNTTEPHFPPTDSTEKRCQNTTLTMLNTNHTVSVSPNCTIPVPDPEEPARFRTLHLDPGDFASLEPRTFLAHYRLHHVWVHGSDGRSYVPVFAGMDISRRCTLYGQYMYITTDPQDCQVLVEVEESGAYAFHRLDELGDDRCNQDYMAFKGPVEFVPHTRPNEWDITGCWEDEWDSGTTILYPSRAVTWPAGWPASLAAAAGLFAPTPASPAKTTVTSTLPPTVSTMTTTSFGADGRPTISVMMTTLPGSVLTTVVDVIPTPTPTGSITVDGTVLTLTNSLGQPTATVTSFSGLAPGQGGQGGQRMITTTLTDSAGRPTATSTITLPPGSNPSGYTGHFPGVKTTVQTIFDQSGVPVTTQTRYIIPQFAPSPDPADPNLVPTQTSYTGFTPSNLPENATRVDPLTWQAYFAGSFLPVILATLLSILVQIMNGSVRAAIPYLALCRNPHKRGGAGEGEGAGAGVVTGVGAKASESLLLPLEGNMFRIDIPLRLAIQHGDPLLLVSNLLQVSGLILASMSSEAVGMTLNGGCRTESFRGCWMSLAVVSSVGRAAEGLLVLMAVLMVLVVWMVGRKRGHGSGREGGGGVETREEMRIRDRKDASEFATGGTYCWSRRRKIRAGASWGREGRIRGLLPTKGDPTSIMGTAALFSGQACSRDGRKGAREMLVTCSDLLEDAEDGDKRVISKREMKGWFAGHRFAMNSEGTIVTMSTPQTNLGRSGNDPEAVAMSPSSGIMKGIRRRYKTFDSSHRNKVLADYSLKVLFLAALGSLLFVVAYYGSTKLDPENPLEKFMDSQTFGVSFLFTGAGAMIDMFWESFFSRAELLEPYRYLSGSWKQDSRRATKTSSMMTRPRSSSTFSGLIRALTHGDLFLSAVAFAGVLSKFLPVFLSNVPFRLTLTWPTFVACTWISVAILGVMVLVMACSTCWVRQPYMPVDPGTIAGKMYYVCDSWFVGDIAAGKDGGLGDNTRKCKDVDGLMYSFGGMTGVSGRERIGVDYETRTRNVLDGVGWNATPR